MAAVWEDMRSMNGFLCCSCVCVAAVSVLWLSLRSFLCVLTRYMKVSNNLCVTLYHQTLHVYREFQSLPVEGKNIPQTEPSLSCCLTQIRDAVARPVLLGGLVRGGSRNRSNTYRKREKEPTVWRRRSWLSFKMRLVELVSLSVVDSTPRLNTRAAVTAWDEIEFHCCVSCRDVWIKWFKI